MGRFSCAFGSYFRVRSSFKKHQKTFKKLKNQKKHINFFEPRFLLALIVSRYLSVVQDARSTFVRQKRKREAISGAQQKRIRLQALAIFQDGGV